MINKRNILASILFLSALCARADWPPQSYRQVEFITPSIVRIQYGDKADYSQQGNATGVVLHKVGEQNVTVKTKDNKKQRVMTSDSLIVVWDKVADAFTFKDRKTGKVLLSETKGVAEHARGAEHRTLKEAVYDESSTHTVQSADGQKIEKNVLRYDSVGHTWRFRVSFAWQKDEGIYGLGSHIEDYMNLKGKTQYLTQHNLKATVPVLTSTKGYGLLFDAGCAMIVKPYDDENPEAGSEVIYESAKCQDYYFMKGHNLDAVVKQYRYLTGDSPMMPRYLFGYTQSKERYCSQQEVVDIVKEYRRRQVPLDMVVQDWNYWPEGWGYMHMDPKYYPDPKAMADSVHAYNAKLMVSIWPNPQYCPQAEDFKKRGFMLEHSVYDAFSPQARDYYWSYADREFFSKGFDAWWCDCSEPLDGDWKNIPNYTHNNHKERYESTKQILSEALGEDRSNLYSLYHSMGIYENQRKASSDKRVVNLTRSSYAGQQRYSTITWNGDTYASWESFRKQIPGGLNFMAAGCPYWSVDVGSFFTNGDRWSRWFYIGEFPKGCNDPAYREYYTRMFQWGTFLPMLRSHGSDTPREIWRFGEPGTPFYDAILDMIHLRYKLLPYTYSLAAKVTNEQYTMARLLAFDFANDTEVLDIKDEYMFGPAMLVCPVTEPSATSRKVYLPNGTKWTDSWTNEVYDGGQWININAPLNQIPLFVREGSIIPTGPVLQYSSQKSDEPINISVFPGKNADFTLYEDEGDNYNYEKGKFSTIPLSWNEKTRTLTIGDRKGEFEGMLSTRKFKVSLVGGTEQEVTYSGKAIQISL